MKDSQPPSSSITAEPTDSRKVKQEDVLRLCPLHSSVIRAYKLLWRVFEIPQRLYVRLAAEPTGMGTRLLTIEPRFESRPSSELSMDVKRLPICRHYLMDFNDPMVSLGGVGELSPTP